MKSKALCYMTVVIFMSCLCWGVTPAGAQDGKRVSKSEPWPSTTPDPALQNKLRAIAQRIIKKPENNKIPQMIGEITTRCMKLKQKVGVKKYATNVCYFMLHSQPMWGIFIYQKLSNITDEWHFANALVPFLADKNDRVRRLAIDFLADVEHKNANNYAESFKTYQYLLGLHGFKRKPSQLLVMHMFSEAPDKAFYAISLVFSNMYVEIVKTFRWPIHVIHNAAWMIKNGYWAKQDGLSSRDKNLKSDAQKQLKFMAQRSEWWARLYAAQVMKQYKPLRVPALVKTLRHDKNQLVRQTIESLQKNKPKSSSTHP